MKTVTPKSNCEMRGDLKIDDVIELRDIAKDDLPFLEKLYATTRYDIDRMDWPVETKTFLLKQQFLAQHQHSTLR